MTAHTSNIGPVPFFLPDGHHYTYDRMGNRLTDENLLDEDFSVTYLYDNLDRLKTSTRADNHDQSWGLDGLGNFGTFTDDNHEQTRGVNATNEITSTTGIATPTYDAAGNMTSDGTLNYNYDAWGRLVKVHHRQRRDNGRWPSITTTAQNRRVTKTLAT